MRGWLQVYRIPLQTMLALILLLAYGLTPARAIELQTRIGSREALQTLDGTAAVDCGNGALWRQVPIVGDAGPVDLSALTPQIVAGVHDGQVCDIVCEDPAAAVTFAHGNGVALTKGGGSFVCGADKNVRLPLSWRLSDTTWVQRGPAKDTAENYTLTPPDDTDIVLSPSGSGLAKVGAAEIVTKPLVMSSGSTTWDGTFTDCDVTEPCVFKGATLEYRIFENGGAGLTGWYNTGTGNPVSSALNIASGLTDTILGNSVPISTDDGATAKRTVHGVVNYCEDAGGDDTYVCAMVPALDRYVTGGLYFLKVTTANTGGASVDFGPGVKTIKKAVGGVTTDLATDDIRANQVAMLQYDGTNMQMQSTLGNAGGGAGTVTGHMITPIRPSSAVPAAAGMVYGCVLNAQEWMCITTATLLTSDARWQLKFNMPTVLATDCTYKLRVDLMIAATPGTTVLSIRPEWNTWAYGAVRPTGGGLVSETVTADQVGGNAGAGTTTDIDIVAADEDKLLYAEWILNAATLTASQPVALDLVAVDATHTLAVESGMDPYIICE